MNWDYIVVGGGSAGCALAARLSERPEIRVLLLEAGGGDWSPVIRIPAGEMLAIDSPKYNWAYPAEPDASRGGRQDAWPAGRVLGGSSSINGMMYIRGNRGDYDGWAQAGNSGWAYDDVLPYFNRAETNENGGSMFRGGQGPLSVSNCRVPLPMTEAFIAAAQQAGIPGNPDVNGPTQEGVGPCQATQKRGWRHSTARAYLAPAVKRRNLTVQTNAFVERVLFDGCRATGVAAVVKNRPISYYCLGEVILCAGAIASPKLLMISGIGRGENLSALGIRTVKDLQGVGQNLQEHPGVIVSTHVTQPTLNLEANSIRKVIKHGLNFIFRGRGPATTCISHAVAFVRTRSNLDWPNVQLSFTPIGYDFSPKGLELYKRACVGVAVNVCRPNGRGAISLRSADPGANPLIKHQLVGDREDLQQMIEGCRLVRKIFSAPAFQAVNGGERAPGEAVQSDEEWEQFVRASAFLMYHPSGTCAMGTGPMAVVDPQLRVHGLSGLRIADASVFPIIPSANTNAPAIMVGERAADLILGDRP